jgi:uncharacterized membrane protein YjdF
MALQPQGLQLEKCCMQFSFLPCVLHVLSIIMLHLIVKVVGEEYSYEAPPFSSFSSFLGLRILLSTYFSNNLREKDQFSHPYKIILAFTF